ncbi:MAG: (2Fe-2S)-binding protein [Thermincola sp.]|jgi:carbon-monoxide dehydrogenase small subunit|nr:(2Fe-2S)-binding protein [Thermincola sp.]MDT3702648.1 (2Fe-2S)-binding protein [Thermincola sp.]
MKRIINIIVNGEPNEVAVNPEQTLLEVLREELGLTGTKKGCNQGECGACTVLVDGKPVSSCLVLAVSVNGKSISTIEGLSRNGHLHPLQEAFVKLGAIQCGFCTPGMLLAAKYLLENNPLPSEQEIKEAIAGNICRCTGYVKIIEAISAVAQGKALVEN